MLSNELSISSRQWIADEIHKSVQSMQKEMNAQWIEKHQSLFGRLYVLYKKTDSLSEAQKATEATLQSFITARPEAEHASTSLPAPLDDSHNTSASQVLLEEQNRLASRIADIERRFSPLFEQFAVFESYLEEFHNLKQGLSALQAAFSVAQVPLANLQEDVPINENPLYVDNIQNQFNILYEQINSLKQSKSSENAEAHSFALNDTHNLSDYDTFLENLFTAIFKHDASTLKHAIHKVNNAFAPEHMVDDEQREEFHKFALWLQHLISALEQLLSISDSIPGLSKLIQVVCQKFITLRTEYIDYEEALKSRNIELHLPTFLLSLDNSQEWFSTISRELRRFLRKTLDPIGYFTEAGDRLIAGDLVAVIDMCDGIANNHSLQKHTAALLSVAVLQDTSPPVGDPFDPINHQVIGSRDGVSRDTIIEISRRGLSYKGRILRKASVVIGR